MVTKAWKVYTPSISKKNPSCYWDWSCESDGTRIFEAYNSDLTGHTTYSIIRITRNTEGECYSEFNGQITDGYFENYYGTVFSQAIDPGSVKLSLSLMEAETLEMAETLASDLKMHQKLHRLEDTLKVILRHLGLTDTLKEVRSVTTAYLDANRKICGWEPEDTPENRAALEKATETWLTTMGRVLKDLAGQIADRKSANKGDRIKV